MVSKIAHQTVFLKQIERPRELEKVLHPTAKCYRAERPDGFLNVIVATEPFNPDGSSGLHVSVSHSCPYLIDQRKPTDDEVRQVAQQFFGELKHEEQNTPRSLVRHLWQI